MDIWQAIRWVPPVPLLSLDLSLGAALDVFAIKDVRIGLFFGGPGVGLEAAGQVFNLGATMLLEDAIGQIAAHANLAEQHHRPGLVQLTQLLTQVIQLDIATQAGSGGGNASPIHFAIKNFNRHQAIPWLQAQ